MEIDFHDNYIFAVLVFMVFVWFARNCLDCLQALFNCLDRCDLSCCCGVQCIGYNVQYCLMMGVKQSLAIFCFMQPVLLCLVVMINNAKQDEDMQSSILLCRATNSLACSQTGGWVRAKRCPDTGTSTALMST